ncbi:hypothetical protein HDU88_008282 [Geranomyces variabilis]|nr:hypothetical protein HDU88_008282 [Geranomyces variabilis]
MSAVEESVIYADSPLDDYLNDVAAADEDTIRSGVPVVETHACAPSTTAGRSRLPWPPKFNLGNPDAVAQAPAALHGRVKQRIHSFLLAELSSTKAAKSSKDSHTWILARTIWVPATATAGWICINVAFATLPMTRIPLPIRMAFNVLAIAGAFPAFHAAIESCRNIHTRWRALAAIDAYLASMRRFDSTVRKGIRAVQEVELVARGYRLTDTLTPIKFIEKSSAAKRCTVLRSAIRNASVCAATELEGGQEVLGSLIEAPDADLTGAAIFDPILTNDEDELAITSLKNALLAVEQMNVDLLSVLLVAVPASGKGDSRWRRRIREIVGIVERVASALDTGSTQIDDASDVKSNFIAESSVASRAGGRAQTPSERKALESLNFLGHRLQELRTKVLITTQDLQGELGVNAVLSRFDALETDITSLSAAWETSRALLSSLAHAPSDPPSRDPSPPATDDADRPSEAEDQPLATYDSIDDADKTLALPGPETVYEACEPAVSPRARGGALKSREERVRARQLQRDAEAVAKAERMTQQSLMAELKDVLDVRRAGP